MPSNPRVRVLLLNGVAQSGKDTVIDTLETLKDTNVIRVSSVDWVKKVAKLCGWTGTKTEEDRLFLATLKDALTQFNESPQSQTIQEVAKQLKALPAADQTFICICAREPRDLEYFKEYYQKTKNYPVTTVLVTRAKAEKNTPNNKADQGVFDYEYDLTLSNNTSLKKFQQTIINIFEE